MKRRNLILTAALIILMAAVVSVLIGCGEKDSKGTVSGGGSRGSSDYFPLGVGSTWEYNVLTILDNGVTKMSKEMVKVVGKERVGEVENYVVDRFALEGTVPSVGQYREFLAKTDKGVECTKRAYPMLFQAKQMYPQLKTEIIHSPSEPRFKNGMKQGDSWKWEGIVSLVLQNPQQNQPANGNRRNQQPPQPPTEKEVKGSYDYKYLGRETIHVMGKDYDCIKISLFGKSDSQQEIESEIWYAPGIGRVREEQTYYEGSNKVMNLFEISNYNITNKEFFKKK